MKFVIGFVVGLLILPVAGFFYFRSGMAPVAAGDSLMPFEGWAARAALHSRIDREMPRSAPIPVSTANLIAGAKIYKDQCWGCHGLRGEEQTESAQAMFPKPPHLLRGKGVTDDSPGETYWKTANGIRLSGMPAFKKVLSVQEIWQVSLFLANADKLPPEAETIVQGGKTRQSGAQNSRKTTPFRATLELPQSAKLRNCCVLNFPPRSLRSGL